MYEARTWRVEPGQAFTFGRDSRCALVLPPGDRGVSRRAGSLRYHDGRWWLHNDSRSCVLSLLGERGFRADLPPGLAVPVQQWRAEVVAAGALRSYTLRLRLPALDQVPDPDQAPPGTGETAVTSTRHKLTLTGDDRLVLAARFESYLVRRHDADPAPCTAREAADRIGWQPHAVTKRCENIRNRYLRLGVPGLKGPRALDELARLVISTGELTTTDLRRLPARTPHP